MIKTSVRHVLSVLIASSLFSSVACSKSKEPPTAASATTGAGADRTAKGAAGDGTGAPTEASSAAAVATDSKAQPLHAPTRALSEFKPKTSGFKFQNYGNEGGIVNLTVVELRRMFGDQVCAELDGNTCILTPAAAQWLEASNKSMDGGHCEGFAALSLLFERGQIDAKAFGASETGALDLKGNDKLQREIAYWFATQGVSPMAEAEDKLLSPVQVLEKISASLQGGDTYTLGIYAPGYKMGHATTPYAVVDKGDDIAWIMHYDNNYPGEEKYIEINKKLDTWSYTTAADPAASEHEYKGDSTTKTLTIAPTSVRTSQMVCHFCGSVDGSDSAENGSKGAVAAHEFREVDYEGAADLLITDENGKRLGYVGGKLVNEIPGAFFSAEKSGAATADDDEPLYYIPAGKKLKVLVDGTSLKNVSESDLYLFGRGYTMDVEGIQLSPGQKDEVDFSSDWSQVTYTTKKAETPTLVIGISAAAGDFQFEVKVTGETAGQTVQLNIDIQKGTFGVQVKGDGSAKPMLAVTLTKIDKAGKQVFKHKGVTTGANEVATFDYANWKGNGKSLHTSMLDAKGAVVSQADEADED